MRTRRRPITIVSVFAALATVLFASGGDARTSATKPTLAIGGTYEYCDSNLLYNWESTTTGVAYEPLIWWNSGGTFRPGLATSWKVSPGNKVITLTLRKNARFSDGTPVTAQSVTTWIAWRAKALAYGVLGPQAFGPLHSVRALGKYVVRIQVRTPNPFLVDSLTNKAWIFGVGAVASPRVVAQMKQNPKLVLTSGTFGAGPYVLDRSQTVAGNHCTYVPNRYYYDKSKIKWSKIVFRLIPNSNAMLAALRTGQLDVGGGDSDTAGAARAAGLKIIQGKPLSIFQGVTFFDLNGALTPAMADVRVRQALNYAIDRRTIVRAFFGQYGAPTSSPFPGAPGNTPRLENYYTYNPARAKALLAAAGYPNGFTLKLIYLHVPQFKALEIAQSIVRYLGAIGVKVDLDTNPSKFGENLGSKTFNGEIAHFYSGNPSALYSWPDRVTQGLTNTQHGWTDPVGTRMYYAALRQGPAKRVASERRLLEHVITQGYWLPVAKMGSIFFVSKKVSGVGVPSEFSYQVLDWSPAK